MVCGFEWSVLGLLLLYLVAVSVVLWLVALWLAWRLVCWLGWFIRLRVGLVLRFVGVVWLLMFAFCVRLGLIVFGGGLICWCGLLMCLVLLVWLIDVGSLVGLA